MDSRASILRTATRLFARRGVAAVSLQAIAEEVGISKPSLLYHFPSKEQLRQCVLDQLFDHWSTALPRLLKAVTSGADRFEALTRELVSFFREDPDRARLIVRELMDRPEEMRARLAETLEPWVKLIADYLEQGMRGAELRADVDAEAYIVHVVTLTIAGIAALPVLSTALKGDREETEHRHLRELLRIARTSLFPDSPKPRPGR